MALEPLSVTRHGHLRLTQGTYQCLDQSPLIPLGLSEASAAALDLPLALRATDAGLQLLAVLSLEGEDNAHIGPRGAWLGGGYMPALARVHPLSAVAGSDNQATVLIDTASDWLSTTAGQPLFTDSGEPSAILQRLLDVLQQQAPHPSREAAALQPLEALDLLTPWEADWNRYDPPLLALDPQALQDLADAPFLRLRSAGLLPLVYAQLASRRRVRWLRQLRRAKDRRAERQAANRPAIQLDDGDNELSFDFGED